jgi:hypothetical protein
MDREEIRRWARNHKAGAEREQLALQENPLTPSQAFAHAMELLAFDELVNGSSPFGRPDPVSLREDEEVRMAWAKLRERWPRGR